MSRRCVRFGISIFLAVAITQAVYAETDEETLGIAGLIYEIRSELIEAEKMMKQAGHPPLFVTKKLDLELSFVVEKSALSTGGFNIRIITLGAEGKYSASSTQKIRLQLETPIPSVTPVSYEQWLSFIAKYNAPGSYFHGLPEGTLNWLQSLQGWRSMNEGLISYLE